MSQHLDTVLQQPMSFVFVLQTAGVFRIVVFQTKRLALRDTEWRRNLGCFFSESLGFHGAAISVAGDCVPAKVYCGYGDSAPASEPRLPMSPQVGAFRSRVCDPTASPLT